MIDPTMLGQSKRRCTRCIVPEEYPGVSFDDEGVCNHCRNYTPRDRPLGREALEAELAKIPTGGEYDCVVPLSGGKDSTFILWHTVKELGLRAIAVNYDAGYQTPQAIANVDNACRILDVPLVRRRAPQRVARGLVRRSIRVSRLARRKYFTCGNCESMLRTVSVQTAREHGVSLVMWGSSPIESKKATGLRDVKSSRAFLVKRVAQRLFSRRGLQTLRLMPGLMSYAVLSMMQRAQMRLPLAYVFRPFQIIPFPSNVRFIHFYDYISWDSIRQVELLRTELEWDHPPETEMRFDCCLHAFGNYNSLRSRNLSADGATMCRFIREGKMDRDAALEREQAIARTVEAKCMSVIRDLGDEPGECVW